MKRLNKVILVFLLAAASTSCSYLDIVPDNVATIEYAFRDRVSAERYLFSCYSYRPPIGSVNLDPAMDGGDETWRLYYRAPFNNTLISRGFQSSTSPLMNFWDGLAGGKALWKGIRDCNIFLENIDAVRDLPDYEKQRWVSEIKFLKAYYHYYLFKCYGPIPLVDTNLPISTGVDEVKVYRAPVDEVVEYVVGLLTEAISGLPEANEIVEGTEAGRADKLVAMMMRAEVLLFAASPLFNGNTDYAAMKDNRGNNLFPQTYDENKWLLAANACKQAIEACHSAAKGLYDVIDPLITNIPDPLKIQTVYRQAIADRWNKELIWGGTSHDARYLTLQSQPKLLRVSSALYNTINTEWAPTLKMAELYYSEKGVPIQEDVEWQQNNWYGRRFEIRPAPSSGEEVYYVQSGSRTVQLHFNRETRFYASLGFDKSVYFGNGYYNFPANVKYTDFFAKGISGVQGEQNYSITGYNVKKMHSFKNGHTADTYSVEYFPFPVYRLADLYLMYAEALNEYNGPDDEVFFYLDAVRGRVGLEGVRESWMKYSTLPEKPASKSGLRQIIQQERNIELAFEGKRFWDIRRWKQIEELNKQPLGWNFQGDNEDDFYRVTQVAQVPVKFTVKDYFFPIMESNIIVNRNLVQNYGW